MGTADRTGVAVGGGGVVGAATVGATVVGAEVAGATVLVVTLMLGSADGDARLADDEGDGDPAMAGAIPARPRKITATSSSVRRLPATAARPRSIHRGPRRGVGGMSFVVSPDMGRDTARVMPCHIRVTEVR